MLSALRRTRPARRRDDDGQMMAPLVIFLGFTVLAFLVVALVPVGAATNERSRSQTAADAAALAGAEEIRTTFASVTTLPGLLLFTPVVPPSVYGASGAGSASSYAAQNGSHVEEYEATPANGRVRVTVEANEAAYPEHGLAISTATAEMDVSFNCRWDDPTPPPPLPTGPPTFTRTLICGAWQATYLITNGNGVYPTISYDTTLTQVYDDLEPRLIT